MPFLMYRDNDSGLRPSSYPYILGRALNEYRINTSVIIYYITLPRAVHSNNLPRLCLMDYYLCIDLGSVV